MMNRDRIGLCVALATSALFGWTTAAQAQVVVPWIVYVDDQSASVCEVVNTAENTQFVVLADTGEMVIVSGPDVILEALVVDEGFVFFEGDAAGIIDFADDADGFRTLWWTDLAGHVVGVDGFTGEPFPTDLFPEEFQDVPCDATELWDGCLSHDECADDNECTLDLCVDGVCTQTILDGTACSDGDRCTISDECVFGECAGILLPTCCLDDDDCDDDNECSLDHCSSFGFCEHTDRDGGCDDGSDCTTADECVSGVCVGALVVDCDDDVVVNPPISIVCGTSSGLTLALTFAGLFLAGFSRRRA